MGAFVSPVRLFLICFSIPFACFINCCSLISAPILNILNNFSSSFNPFFNSKFDLVIFSQFISFIS